MEELASILGLENVLKDLANIWELRNDLPESQVT
jgi:hypothetical protein